MMFQTLAAVNKLRHNGFKGPFYYADEFNGSGIQTNCLEGACLSFMTSWA